MRVCALHGCRSIADPVSYGHNITVQMDQQRNVRVPQVMQSDLTHAAGLAHAVLIPGDRLIFQKEQPVVPGKVIDMPRVLLQIRHDRRRHGDRAEAVQCLWCCGLVCAPWERFIYAYGIFIEINIRERQSPQFADPHTGIKKQFVYDPVFNLRHMSYERLVFFQCPEVNVIRVALLRSDRLDAWVGRKPEIFHGIIEHVHQPGIDLVNGGFFPVAVN